MQNKKILGAILVVVALFVGVYTFGRAMYENPGTEDSGLVAQGSMVEAYTISDTTPPAPEALPSRLEIPEIGVDAHVQHLGITSSGLMAVPSNFTDVGWYKYGPTPGERGSAVIAGHQNNAMGLDGVFQPLEKLEVGDDVYVVSESGEKLHFRVRRVELHPYDLKGPQLEEIFQDTSGTYLNLITCAGNWIQEIKTNDLRLVVYTELVE